MKGKYFNSSRLLPWCIISGVAICILAAIPPLWKMAGVLYGIWLSASLVAVVVDAFTPAEGREPIDESTTKGKMESALVAFCAMVGTLVHKVVSLVAHVFMLFVHWLSRRLEMEAR